MEEAVLKDKETSLNPIAARLGRFAVEGGPGRKPGIPNKFTMIKQQMVEVWEEEIGKEKFRAMFLKKFPHALDRIISIMPKETSVDAKIDITNKNFFYQMAQKAGLLDADGQSPSRTN